MKYFYLFIGLFFLANNNYSQNSSDFNLIKDTVRIPTENKVAECEYMITTLKNGSTIQLIKAPANKFYLKIVTSENLYFGKTDMLEIQSDSRSLSLKTTNYELNKNTGYYIVEIYKNYIGTLKEVGITGLVFDKAETKYSKQDCIQIKQMAKSFYEIFCAKKK